MFNTPVTAMKLKIAALLLVTICFCHIGYGQVTSDTLFATQLKPVGRFSFQGQQLELVSSAVHFGFSFKGTGCSVYASITDANGHNYLQYELDGVYQKRIRINGNSTDPVIITAPGAGTHKIWIYKATEAHTGPIMISKIVASKVRPLSIPKGPLIEFIGNSITCGAAADASEVACGTGVYHDQHNAYMAYGPRVARVLHANFMLSSVSGIGIYRTWNLDGPSMPQVYENLDFHLENPRPWDFKLFTPKVVSIALGTNDLSTGDGKTPRKPFDPDTFIDSYVKFVKLVKSKYPQARIVLLSSPMVSGWAHDTLEKCLTSVKQKIDVAYPADRAVKTFFFKQMNGRGCGGHPSVEDHAIMAEALIPTFKELLQ